MELLDEYVKGLKENRFSGATLIAKYALDTFLQYCELPCITSPDQVKAFLNELIKQSITIKPDRAPLENSLDYINARAIKWDSLDIDLYKNKIKEAVIFYLHFLKQSQEMTAIEAADFLKGGTTFMTICSSSTIIQSMTRLSKFTPGLNIIVLETRPDYNGWVTAKELGANNIKVTLIIDSASSSFIENVDAVITGADVVFPNGCIINRIGTLNLALVAKRFNKPVYAITSSYTFRNIHIPGYQKRERNPTAVVPEEVFSLWENVLIRNIADDFVPAEYLNGVITDKGYIQNKDIQYHVKKFDKWIRGEEIDSQSL
jgi:ribose 1,5-bisphosphate isomerase